jgi:hypothetical protein
VKALLLESQAVGRLRPAALSLAPTEVERRTEGDLLRASQMNFWSVALWCMPSQRRCCDSWSALR